MAKLVCSFDTKTKQLEVSLDGQILDNVEGLSLYKKYKDNSTFASDENTDDEYYCTINMFENIKELGYVKSIQLMASESIEGKELVKNNQHINSKYPDFIQSEKTNSRLVKNIKDLLGR